MHLDIKMIITMQYHSYPPLRALTTEITLRAIKFISTLVMWIDDTYESLIAGGNVK